MRSEEVSAVSRLTEGMLEKPNGHEKKVNFTTLHVPQYPFPLISVSLPKGAITLYYTYPRFMTPLLSTSLPLSPC